MKENNVLACNKIKQHCTYVMPDNSWELEQAVSMISLCNHVHKGKLYRKTLLVKRREK